MPELLRDPRAEADAAAVARGPLGGETGTVILTVPNYHLDAIADQSGVPLALISANVTFNLPVTLNVSGAQIAPSVGAIDLTDVRVTDNPIGADPTKFATGVTTLFPLAAPGARRPLRRHPAAVVRGPVGRGRRLGLQRRLRGDLPEPAVSRAGGATRAHRSGRSRRGRSERFDSHAESRAHFQCVCSRTSHPRRWWHPQRTSDDQFRTYLSSKYAPNHADLPWLDEEKSLFIAIGDYGDDTGFALDYRPNPDRPRVVGGFWEGDYPKSWAIVWKRIADSFDEFARSLGF